MWIESARCGWSRPLEELFGRIRRVQADLGLTTPILTRLPNDDRLTACDPEGVAADGGQSSYDAVRKIRG